MFSGVPALGVGQMSDHPHPPLLPGHSKAVFLLCYVLDDASLVN
jgi:hypothetical protein